MATFDPEPRVTWHKTNQRLVITKTQRYNLPSDQTLPSWLHPLPLGTVMQQILATFNQSILQLADTIRHFPFN